jgi:hypothetical protein
MDKPVKINVADSEGTEQSCLLIGKSNNQNGGTLYTFRNENLGNDFTIMRHNATWTHLNGVLPHYGCVPELGNFLDHLDEQ